MAEEGDDGSEGDPREVESELEGKTQGGLPPLQVPTLRAPINWQGPGEPQSESGG